MQIRRQRRRWLVVMAFGLMAASVLVGQGQAAPDLEGAASSSGGVQQPVGPGEENLRAIDRRVYGVTADDAAARGTVAADGWSYDLITPRSSYEIPSVPDSGAAQRTFGGGAVAAPVVTDDGTEFNWRDAGLGALGAAALLALMATLAIVVRRDRHRGGLATS